MKERDPNALKPATWSESVPSPPSVSWCAPKLATRRPARSRRKASGGDASWLIALFACAATITPEFTFYGIPKVRLTDLLLPPLTLVLLGRMATLKGGLPLLAPMATIVAWDTAVLYFLGSGEHVSTGTLYLGKRGIYFLIYSVGLALIQSREGFRKVIWMLIVAAPVLNLTVLSSLSRSMERGDYRSSGIIENQETSTVLFLILILSLVLGIWPAAQRNTQRIGLFVALASTVFAILATGSKTGLILAILGSTVLLVRASRRSPWLIVLVVGVGTAGYFLTPDEVLERYVRIKSETTNTAMGLAYGEEYMGRVGGDSLADRYYAAKRAMTVYIPQAPITGHGMASIRLGNIDNFYVTEWLFNGLIGLLLWFWLLFGLAGLLRQAYRTAEDELERGVAAGAMTAMACMCVAGWTSDSFYLIRPMEVFMLVIGLVIGRQRLRRESPELCPKRGRFRRIRGPGES